MKKDYTTEYKTLTNYTLEYKSLSTITNVSHFENSKDLYVVKLGIEQIITGDKNSQSTHVWEKIINQEFIEKLNENISQYEVLAKQYTLPKDTLLVNKEFLSILKQYGNDNYIFKLDSLAEKNLNDFISKTPYTDIDKEDMILIQSIGTVYGKKVYKDIHNMLYIEPFRFNYVDGNLDNDTYDLERLVNHLSKRDDITFILEGRHKAVAKCPITDENVQIVQSIPSYNRTEERTHSISFIYYPKQEDIMEIMALDIQDSYKLNKLIINEILQGKYFSTEMGLQYPSASKKLK